MQRRRLGLTTIEVSVLGLGTVKFGRQKGVGYPAPFDLPSDKEMADLLAFAQAQGVNLLDTAPAYGLSEERLGKCLATSRHEWVISTKVGEEFVDGKSQFDFSAAAMRDSIDRSLQRLRTDYLDIVLVHSNGDDCHLIQEETVFTTLDALKTAGKIRAFGMSTKTIEGGLLTLDVADVAMVTFNPHYLDERAVIAHAHQHQKGIFIKKALASGHFSHLGSAADALRFAVNEPGVTSVIVGTINRQHLQENLQAVGAVNLT